MAHRKKQEVLRAYWREQKEKEKKKKEFNARYHNMI
jgi:hypothetical protein